MGMEEHTHGDGTKHKVKTVNVEVFGLKFDDTSGQQNVIDALGIDSNQFADLGIKMIRFFEFQEAQRKLEPELPQPTNISMLSDFLQSHFFREQPFRPTTPNHYFALGTMYQIVLAHIDEEEKKKHQPFGGIPLPGGIGIPVSGEKLAEIISTIKKKRENDGK